MVTEVAERSLAGADVLNLLSDTEARTAGTPFARGVLRELLAATCEPYLRILHRWVAEGALDDPYQEFLVEESASYVPKPNSTMSDWWTSRCVPGHEMAGLGDSQRDAGRARPCPTDYPAGLITWHSCRPRCHPRRCPYMAYGLNEGPRDMRPGSSSGPRCRPSWNPWLTSCCGRAST